MPLTSGRFGDPVSGLTVLAYDDTGLIQAIHRTVTAGPEPLRHLQPRAVEDLEDLGFGAIWHP
ncbi:hypothetical protein OG840_17140 [Streptomyces sp. NBC_01764]|uniref:hypothetical protein n=1 Tax=Streptomyces sp. NBC_01764 TaxID=2975935 RepID=UPI002254855D|nr:hypothetical protein [Streptomyces sp. NBC_01764]MCX4403491.1 hypothetical protein [Streptomyces sp. NBC_01764]